MATEHLSHQDVRDIAELAKLELSDDDVAMYAEQLSQILSYFTTLQAVDTSQVDPAATITPLRSVMRPDDHAQALPIDAVLANAPDAEAQQFKVNVVLNND